jgi:pyruvate/2-oxoglutarate dehydrogenase complex dihydrolipoamide acyltransferase (E2) component
MDVLIPAGLWDEDGIGVLSTWFFEEGDAVRQGTVIAEVMSEKVSFEIAAPCDGTLRPLLAVETEVCGGQVIGRIEPA